MRRAACSAAANEASVSSRAWTISVGTATSSSADAFTAGLETKLSNATPSARSRTGKMLGRTARSFSRSDGFGRAPRGSPPMNRRSADLATTVASHMTTSLPKTRLAMLGGATAVGPGRSPHITTRFRTRSGWRSASWMPDGAPAEYAMTSIWSIARASRSSTNASACISGVAFAGNVDPRYPNRDGTISSRPGRRSSKYSSPTSHPPKMPWIRKRGSPPSATVYSTSPTLVVTVRRSTDARRFLAAASALR